MLQEQQHVSSCDHACSRSKITKQKKYEVYLELRLALLISSINNSQGFALLFHICSMSGSTFYSFNSKHREFMIEGGEEVHKSLGVIFRFILHLFFDIVSVLIFTSLPFVSFTLFVFVTVTTTRRFAGTG